MSYPTSRRYARTLAQAFPRDPESACAIEAYRRPWLARLSAWAGAVFIGVIVGTLIVLAIRASIPA